jgi:hypothetical protein
MSNARTLASNAIPFRDGDSLSIGDEFARFGRHSVALSKSGRALQHRLFTTDPWAMIAEGVHRSLLKGRAREIAHSFLSQAEDFFRAATAARELAVRPLLLYYAFLNLAKAFAVSKGNQALIGQSFHGLKSRPKPRAITGSIIEIESESRAPKGVFQDFLIRLGGDKRILGTDVRLGELLPQILPGHRLWCYAAHKTERFLTVDHFQLRHRESAKQVWLNIFVTKASLAEVDVPASKV